jgi:hypothetical protein
MKRFLRSKLVLTLTVLLLLVSSMAVALSGNIVHSHAATATQIPFNKTFNSADCSAAVLVTNLNAGDKVSGTVDYVNVGDPTEASQHENLILQESNGPFTQTFTVDSGTQPISFTAAANNDSLLACITPDPNTGGQDSDQQATIKGTVTLAPTPTPTPSPSPTHSPIEKLCDKFGGFVNSLCDKIASGIGSIPKDVCLQETPACKALEERIGKTFCNIQGVPIGQGKNDCSTDIQQDIGHILLFEGECKVGIAGLEKIPVIGPILEAGAKLLEPLECLILGAVKDVSR